MHIRWRRLAVSDRHSVAQSLCYPCWSLSIFDSKWNIWENLRWQNIWESEVSVSMFCILAVLNVYLVKPVRGCCARNCSWFYERQCSVNNQSLKLTLAAVTKGPTLLLPKCAIWYDSKPVPSAIHPQTHLNNVQFSIILVFVSLLHPHQYFVCVSSLSHPSLFIVF